MNFETGILSRHTPDRVPPPIGRLPVELLAYIFTLSTHGEAGPSGDDASPSSLPFDTDSIHIPLVLSSVSRHWRAVALDAPALWTSLCITHADIVETMGLGDTSLKKTQELDTRHLTSYLRLSRNASIDILIDARDEHWDFSETEVQSYAGFSTYEHPFPSVHMGTVLDHLLPHLRRWRSLTILTDTYAPMYVALQRLCSAYVPSHTPLRLESLTLMRCNEYVAHFPEFTPPEFSSKFCLPFEALISSAMDEDIQNLTTVSPLPRLRNITLSGVHIDWYRLPRLLPEIGSDHPGLESLELSYHSAAVRPSLDVFRNTLLVCPRLKSLALKVSGPLFSEDDNTGRIPLSALEDLTLSYTSAGDACKMLHLLDTPRIKKLTLEDGSYPTDVFDKNAGSLLTYCGTGQSKTQESLHSIINAAVVSNPTPFTATHASKGTTTDDALRSPFPLLETVTLNRVSAHHGPYKIFFSGLPTLQHVSLVRVPSYATEALLHETCPCPALRSLCIRGVGRGRTFDGVLDSIVRTRGCGLREVSIYADEVTSEDEVKEPETVQFVDGTRVKVWGPSHSDCHCEDEDSDMGSDSGSDMDVLENREVPDPALELYNDPAWALLESNDWNAFTNDFLGY